MDFLGGGSFGMVFAGKSLKDDKEVAVKIIQKSKINDSVLKGYMTKAI